MATHTDWQQHLQGIIDRQADEIQRLTKAVADHVTVRNEYYDELQQLQKIGLRYRKALEEIANGSLVMSPALEWVHELKAIARKALEDNDG